MLVKIVVAKVADKPGGLGKVSRCLAKNEINIEGFAVAAGEARFLTRDPEAAAACLEREKIKASVVDAFELTLPNRPGELAKIGERLGEASINIEATFGLSIGEVPARVFIQVDDLEKAEPLLHRLAAEATAPGTRG